MENFAETVLDRIFDALTALSPLVTVDYHRFDELCIEAVEVADDVDIDEDRISILDNGDNTVTVLKGRDTDAEAVLLEKASAEQAIAYFTE